MLAQSHLHSHTAPLGDGRSGLRWRFLLWRGEVEEETEWRERRQCSLGATMSTFHLSPTANGRVLQCGVECVVMVVLRCGVVLCCYVLM